MARFRTPLLASLLFLSIALSAVLPGLGDAQALDHLVISEVLYDPAPPGNDSDLEWVEIYNPTGAPVTHTGWKVHDNTAQDVIPTFTLGAGQYLVVAAKEAPFRERYPGFAGNLVSLESYIGNGLSNTGDMVVLLDSGGNEIDAMSYGSGASDCPKVPEGQSLARKTPWQDTDTAADWAAQPSPNPSEGPAAPTVTPSPTATATPTATPTTSDTPTSTATASAGPSPTPTSSATPTSSPTETGTATPTATATVDATATMTATPTPTPTGTLTPAPTATASPTPSPTTAATPTPTASPTTTRTTTRTSTPTATSTSTATGAPTALPRLRLNEFLPYPDQIDWNGDGTPNFEDEWIELINLEAFPVDLTGWMLDDVAAGGSNPYTFEAGTLLPAHSFLLRFRSTTKVALNQDLDTVRLVAPDGAEVDSYTYAQTQRDGSYSRTIDGAGAWTDTYPPSPGSPNLPPAATATPTRTPPRTSTPSRTPSATPTATALPSTARPGAVVINEIMQNPQAVDDSHGEWIELFNATDTAIDLNGWTIRDLESDHHRIAATGPLWLPAHGYLVLGRDVDPATNGGVPVAYRYTGFTLGNADDEVILEDGAGTEIDRVAYGPALGFPSPTGASMALIEPGRDNARGANWRASFTAWPGSAGDLGSPGAANPLPPAQIEGHIFEDVNRNAHRDDDELGLPGVWVGLSTGALVHTDANGWYGFYGLPAGAYVVTELQPEGFTSTMPDELAVTVGPGEISWGHDFGDVRTAPPTPTPTATPTPPGSPSAWPRVLLSEVFYDAPQAGTDSAYEWVEVWNGDMTAVNLGGWRLRDNAAEDVLPAFELAPGEYLVIAASSAGFAANFPDFTGKLMSLESSIGGGLGNNGDRLLLLAPDGSPADAMSYGEDATVFDPPCPDAPAGASLARVPVTQDTDSAADWAIQLAPNPGAPGAGSTPTPMATATIPPTPSPTGTTTPTWSPTPTSTPTPTASATLSLGPTPVVRLNEVLPRPSLIDWDGDGRADLYDEWVEVFNPGPAAAALGGWLLDDVAEGGSKPYVIPAGTTLLPGDFLLLFRRQTGVALNNDSDMVRLLAPDGAEIDAFAYANPAADASYSRTIDGGGDWTDTYPPSPGRSNRSGTPTATPSASPTPTGTATASPTPSPTPTATAFPFGIFLNEILPDPDARDWNGDGTVDGLDEWLELYNISASAVNLGGWAVADDTGVYTLPLGTMIWPRSYLTLFRSQTHRSLGNTQDVVSLLRPDGSPADIFSYTQGPGADRSYCRDVDGIGAWLRGCVPTPGEANQLPPPPPEPCGGGEDAGSASSFAPAIPMSIAAARGVRIGTYVTIVGDVSMTPGAFSRRFYLQDDSGGVAVYLRRGEFPPLALGDRVSATGRVGSSYGEVQIEVTSQSRIVVLGRGTMPIPHRLRTGDVGEANEGLLAWVFGRVVTASHTSIILDDGSGPAQIYFPEGLPWRRPYVRLGDAWGAQGVVGQYDNKAPYTEGYRVIPRVATDFSQAPMFLPVTGIRPQ